MMGRWQERAKNKKDNDEPDPRAYPAFQSLCKKLRQHFLPEPLAHLSDRSILVVAPSFLRPIASVLNQILVAKILTDQERLTVRDLLSLPTNFVFHLLPMLLEWAVIPSTIHNNNVRKIYCKFCLFARKDLKSNGGLIGELHVIKTRKERSRQYRKQLKNSGIFRRERIHVHRFHHRPSTTALKKKIVVDCCDEEHFPLWI